MMASLTHLLLVCFDLAGIWLLDANLNTQKFEDTTTVIEIPDEHPDDRAPAYVLLRMPRPKLQVQVDLLSTQTTTHTGRV